MVTKIPNYLLEFKSEFMTLLGTMKQFILTKCMMLQMTLQWRHYDVTIVGHICPSHPLLGRHIYMSFQSTEEGGGLKGRDYPKNRAMILGSIYVFKIVCP